MILQAFISHSVDIPYGKSYIIIRAKSCLAVDGHGFPCITKKYHNIKVQLGYLIGMMLTHCFRDPSATFWSMGQ